MSKAQPAVKEAIIEALKKVKGKQVTAVNDTALREQLGLDCSTNEFRSALGSLVKERRVYRTRPKSDSLSGSQERRTTVRLRK